MSIHADTQRVPSLRREFFTQMEQFGPNLFHPADIARVKTDDEYLLRFLKHNEGSEKAALKMLWDTCSWRVCFGVNDINEDNVNQAILKSGGVFPHGRDKDGKTLLIFKSKLHHKDQYDFDDQKKCLVYWLERLEREGEGDMISLFFDLDGASLGNMDVDYTLYLINLFKCYYPYFLNNIIVFEMAWVLNAVFKLIKSWLPPEAVEKLRFVDKSTVTKYVNKDNCLVSWGGTDNYVYTFTPEKKTSPAPVEEEDIRARKVRFDEACVENDNLSESGFEESTTPPIKLKISPQDTMLFSNDGDDAISSIMVKNEDVRYISYKIKTTSPMKFGVRPSLGVLSPNTSAVINIVLHQGYSLQSLQRDKFLIMGIPLDQSTYSSEELADLWKRINEKDVLQCKLRCFMPGASSQNGSDSVLFAVRTAQGKKAIFGLCSDVAALNVLSENMKKEMQIIKRQQWAILFCIILVLLSLWYFMLIGSTSEPSSQSQNCWTENNHL